MRERVERVPTHTDAEHILDTCGTGGAPKTFNVSTAAAIIAAACGAKVAKHGNRSRTGRGSAQVLSELGVNVDASREVQARCLDEVGICFCFAIHHHPATKHVMPIRLALGIPTIFNLLGPLTNPAGARRQFLGVYAPELVDPIAKALQALGSSRAVVLHSEDGLDEVSISAPTRVVHVTPSAIETQIIAPEDFGFARAPREQVTARDLSHAAQMVRDVLSGRDQGPARDMTVMSSALALVVAGKAKDLREGAALASAAISSGRAQQTLEALAAVSQRGSQPLTK